MKALTLHQPYASLVSLGVKTIETRSWSTKYRGPLAIHAGTKDVVPLGGMHLPPLVRSGPFSEQDAHNHQTWFVIHTITDPAYQGPRVVNPATGRTSRVPRRAQAPTLFWPMAGPHHRPSEKNPKFSHTEHLPLGAVVATCTLVDVVPTGLIVWTGQTADGWIHGGPPYEHHPAPAYVSEDQRPYGDFTAGRYAWLLADIEPVDPPSIRPPGEWHRGLWEWTP